MPLFNKRKPKNIDSIHLYQSRIHGNEIPLNYEFRPDLITYYLVISMLGKKEAEITSSFDKRESKIRLNSYTFCNWKQN